MDNREADLWLHMVVQRHERWRARQGYAASVQADPILDTFKFTNVFRVLDYGSQYLLRELLAHANTPQDALFLSALYRYVNRPEPFEYLVDHLGHAPTLADAQAGTIKRVWTDYDDAGGRFFGNAYANFSGQGNPGRRWHWALRLSTAIGETPGFHHVAGQQAQVEALLHHPRVGVFMSQQIVTDYNYSRHYRGDENDHVFFGPGSTRGMKRLHPELSVKEIHSNFDALARNARAMILLEAPQVTLQGRPPSLMDVQNTFCEFGKYRKIADTGKGRRYRSLHPSWAGYVLPAHWNLTPKENRA